jgi:orotidine-5'-phosphate decarboxylase
MENNKIISKHLVSTDAYTDLPKIVILASGKPGIYYVNTEKLAQDGGEFNKYGNSSKLMIDHAVRMTKEHPTFEEVINILAEQASELLKGKDNPAISGGQRRDWLFSGPVARKLDLPHISLYKDLSDKGLEVLMPDGNVEFSSSAGFYAVHIADLLTEASSCCKQPEGWVPQLRAAGNTITDLVAVVSRQQGGEANLKNMGVTAHCQVAIDEEFLKAHSKNPERALEYQADERKWSEKHLREHGALEILDHFDPKAKKMDRVRLFLGIYGSYLDSVGKKEELKNAVIEKYHKNNYLDQLKKSAKENNSIVCMGLDPVISAMPSEYAELGITGVALYFEELFNEMNAQKVLPGAFKPNQGYYLRHDKPLQDNFAGSKTLACIINMIKQQFPEIPIILDYKRGDIATSSANYAAEAVDSWESDAMTVAPYMGFDSVGPFADTGKGVYILNRTSNKGAVDLQDLNVIKNGKEMSLYEAVAYKIIEWAEFFPGVGAVVGATYPDELGKIAKIYSGKHIPLLIPGVGGQGGRADEVISRLIDANYDLSIARINSSSGLTHPWKEPPVPEDYAKVCVAELDKLNRQINFKPA